MGSVKCRCYESVWHEAEARAGLIFVFLGFCRILVGALLPDKRFNWLVWAFMCGSSPGWIHLTFDVVLRLGEHVR